MIRHRMRSPLWRCSRMPSLGKTSEKAKEARGAGKKGMHRTRAVNRLTAVFEYQGPPQVEDARRLGVV